MREEIEIVMLEVLGLWVFIVLINVNLLEEC